MVRMRWSSDSRAPPCTSRCAASTPTTERSVFSGTTTKAIIRSGWAPKAPVRSMNSGACATSGTTTGIAEAYTWPITPSP